MTTRLCDIDLSTRTRNCLMNNHGLETLEDVAECSDVELLRFPNFGRRSLNEIKEVMSRHCLSLRTYNIEMSVYITPEMVRAGMDVYDLDAFDDSCKPVDTEIAVRAIYTAMVKRRRNR